VFDHFQVELIIPKVNERLTEDEILAYAGKFDGTICGDDRYTERVIRACAPRLKVISKWGTGIDSIDKKTAESLGIPVLNTPSAFTVPVADSVMAYILTFARRLPWMDRAMKAGEWKKIPGKALSECTLGVIGVGAIGQAVIQRAHAFGMKILGNDIKPITTEFTSQYNVEMTSLEEIMKKSDFISVNADLNPTSRHLINQESLSNVKPSAILINTARGPIVDERALVTALRENRLAGAGLDVFEDEPLPEKSPLKKMDNVLLAPHNSNSSPKAWENVHWNSIYNLLTGLKIQHEDLDMFKKRI
jgi:D-3-phosphoglycerate dehydrogenase